MGTYFVESMRHEGRSKIVHFATEGKQSFALRVLLAKLELITRY